MIQVGKPEAGPWGVVEDFTMWSVVLAGFRHPQTSSILREGLLCNEAVTRETGLMIRSWIICLKLCWVKHSSKQNVISGRQFPNHDRRHLT